MPTLQYPILNRSWWTLPIVLLTLGVLGGISPAEVLAQEARVTVRTVSGADPVEGVQLLIGSLGGHTDARGEYMFRLPLGEYSIESRHLGFADAQLTLLLASSRDTTLVIELQEQVIEAEEIIVSSTRTDRRIEDEPLRVEVVTREEVEEKLLMTPGDIAMLLNETAGLRVQPTLPSLGGASVRIQGLRGRYTQILSDGLPLYGGQAGASVC